MHEVLFRLIEHGGVTGARIDHIDGLREPGRYVEALQRRSPRQKVIVLSNHSSRDVRWRCEQLGADAVFDKSTELEALVDYCLKMLDSTLAEAAAAVTPQDLANAAAAEQAAPGAELRP